MRLDMATEAVSDYEYRTDEFKQIYYYECKDGRYLNYTAKELEDPYYNYYALTFVMNKYSYTSLKQTMTFRAYARLDDGSIVYVTKIYRTRIYDIAQNLYQNKKTGSRQNHEFLYRNVLNPVKMEENRVDICYSMLNALKVSGTNDERYTMINNISRDIVDYVYCQGEYTYSLRQSEDMEFVPKRLSETELLELLDGLNTATSSSYTSLSDWIYNETEKIKTYKGFYKKVKYDWDDAIYAGAGSL